MNCSAAVTGMELEASVKELLVLHQRHGHRNEPVTVPVKATECVRSQLAISSGRMELCRLMRTIRGDASVTVGEPKSTATRLPLILSRTLTRVRGILYSAFSGRNVRSLSQTGGLFGKKANWSTSVMIATASLSSIAARHKIARCP
jgi:hypothetical protein